MKYIKFLTILMIVFLPVLHAQDTEIRDVNLPANVSLNLGKFKDGRIKGVSYRVDEKKAVFVSDGPLTDQDKDDLKRKLEEFSPEETPEESRIKELSKKQNINLQELVELLKAKGII